MAVVKNAVGPYTTDPAPNFNVEAVPPPNPDPSNYGVPELEDAPYLDVLGWAPSFRVGELPDPLRTGRWPNRTTYPPNPDAPHYRELDRDEASRHSVEDWHTTGYAEKKEGSGKQLADNPYRKGWPEPGRYTSPLTPQEMAVTRPFDQSAYQKGVGARNLNGEHFSMADHRRNYEIYGMAPVTHRRNTFRLDPAPWDELIVDYPSPSPIRSVDVPDSTGSRSYRLG